jgi:hypothetical protein
MRSQRSRRPTGGVALALCALCVLAPSMACESVPLGPSLTKIAFIGINNSQIQTNAGWRVAQLPTVFLSANTGVRDPSVCCCHIRGFVSNANSVPVHVIVQFAAMSPNDTELARIVNFVQDLQPGATYRIPDDGPGAAGFLLPCATIDHVNFQLNVSSLAPPLL